MMLTRNVLYLVVTLALVVVLAGKAAHAREQIGQPDSDTSAEDSKYILLISTKLDHPWATHMYRQGCNLLAACLNNTPGVKAIVSPEDDWPKDPAALKGVDAIVFYSRPAGDLLLHPRRRNQAMKLLKSGVGLTAIHWATGTTDDQYGPEYMNLLGGWFSFAHAGLKVDKRLLQQAKADHPVCKGWKPYKLRDEFYLNLKFSEQAQPILQVNVDGVEQTVAWCLERPNSKGGRSFGTTLGHFHDNFTIDEFRRAIVNGILWTAHVELPKTGADVTIPKAKLTLPDPPPPKPVEPIKDELPKLEAVESQ
ncbi:MAG: ThuA domain-containing protein [Lacipirellulaceae bacterium]